MHNLVAGWSAWICRSPIRSWHIWQTCLPTHTAPSAHKTSVLFHPEVAHMPRTDQGFLLLEFEQEIRSWLNELQDIFQTPPPRNGLGVVSCLSYLDGSRADVGSLVHLVCQIQISQAFCTTTTWHPRNSTKSNQWHLAKHITKKTQQRRQRL